MTAGGKIPSAGGTARERRFRLAARFYWKAFRENAADLDPNNLDPHDRDIDALDLDTFRVEAVHDPDPLRIDAQEVDAIDAEGIHVDVADTAGVDAVDKSDALENVSEREEKSMVVVPLSQASSEPGTPQPITAARATAGRAAGSDGPNWVRMAAVGSLAVSGILLVTGRRRAGLVAAASGTALAMLDQQVSLKAWWEMLPVYLDEVQLMLSRAQGVVDDIAVQRERVHRILSK